MGERGSKIWLVVLALVLFVGGWIFLYKDALFVPPNAFESSLGKPVPDLVLFDGDGSEIRLREFLKKRFEEYPETKQILLPFWATWCSPCVKELPLLQQKVNNYEKSGARIVLINFDSAHREENRVTVNKWLNEHELVLETIFDPRDSLIQALEVSALPFNASVDRNLNWSFGSYGALDFEAFEKLLSSQTEN